MNLDEAGKVLGVSPRRVKQLLEDGRLHGTKVGRVWSLEKAEVVAFGKLPRPVGRRPSRGRAAANSLRAAEPPLMAFLSTVMNLEVEDLIWARRAAVDEIELISEFDVWAFEETPGNSDNIAETYVPYIDKSDCVLWIVGRELTPAVQAEIDRALKLGKRILMFRLTDDSTAETEKLIRRVETKWVRADDVDGLRNGIRLTLEDELKRYYRRGQDQASELTILNRLDQSSRSRMLSRWLAVDMSIEAARQLLARADLPTVPPDLARDLAHPVKVLVAGPGTGKSTVAERVHQADISAYRVESGSPIPVFLLAGEVGSNMLRTVQEASANLGDPDKTGVSVVIDGLDEVGWARANEQIIGSLAVTQRWPGSTVLLTARPFPETPSGVALVNLSPLDAADARELVRAIAGPQLHPWSLDSLPGPIAESIRLPLFAILMGVYISKRGGSPGGTGDLLSMATQWSLKGLISSEKAEELMRALAARLTDSEGTSVEAASITTSMAELSALRSTRVLVESQGYLGFALPMLEQWFAGLALLSAEVAVDDLIADEARLQRWLPAIAMAVQAGDPQSASRILGPIARHAPGYLPIILRDARVATHPSASPTVDDCARELRQAMESLNLGWGPLSPLLLPQRRDRTVGAIGLALHDKWLTVSWNRHAPPGTDRLDLPVFADGTPWPKGWDSVRGSETQFDATWAWRWCLDHIQGNLKTLLGAQPDALAPSPLRDELIWAAAIELAGRGRLDPGPITMRELSQGFETAVGAEFGAKILEWPLRYQWLYARIVQDMAGGTDAFLSPWPAPDLATPTGGWVWSLYSVEQLRKRAEQVYLAAMDAYVELVDTWFQPVASRLVTRAILPARLVGMIERENEFRGMRWYLDPLPEGEPNRVVISVLGGDEMPSLVDDETPRALYERLRKSRPRAAGWIHARITDQILHIYETTPASDICYEWLASDLRALRWIN